MVQIRTFIVTEHEYHINSLKKKEAALFQLIPMNMTSWYFGKMFK